MMYKVRSIQTLSCSFGQLCANTMRRNFLTQSNLRLIPWSGSRSGIHTSVPLLRRLSMSEEESYRVLGLAEDFDREQLKDAYVEQVKMYHPDSGSPSACARTFARIKEAHKVLSKKLQKEGRQKQKQQTIREVKKSTFDNEHTAVEHRRYLNFEGVGTGTPSSRLRQYQKYRAQRASDRVMEYRTDKLMLSYGNNLVVKDQRAAKKHVIRNALHRLSEDLIQESMKKGEFDNLPGAGKPLQHDMSNPYIDSATRNMNKVLIQNGYTPAWITAENAIRQHIQLSRAELLEKRARLGPSPLDSDKEYWWSKYTAEFKRDVDMVNREIDKYNLQVPSIHRQMVHYRTEKEIEKICRHFDENGYDKPLTNVPRMQSKLLKNGDSETLKAQSVVDCDGNQNTSQNVPSYYWEKEKLLPSLREIWQVIRESLPKRAAKQ